jgi:hypothetical protein
MKLAAVTLTTAATVCCAPPLVTTAPAAAGSSSPSSCYPQTKSGNCYEPGEMCRKGDRGSSGVSGGGESIRCEDNDGWRWEPS